MQIGFDLNVIAAYSLGVFLNCALLAQYWVYWSSTKQVRMLVLDFKASGKVLSPVLGYARISPWPVSKSHLTPRFLIAVEGSRCHVRRQAGLKTPQG